MDTCLPSMPPSTARTRPCSPSNPPCIPPCYLYATIDACARASLQAHVASVSSMGQVQWVIRSLLEERRIARATHNMIAYRFWDATRGVQVADNDDDGCVACVACVVWVVWVACVACVACVAWRAYSHVWHGWWRMMAWVSWVAAGCGNSWQDQQAVAVPFPTSSHLIPPHPTSSYLIPPHPTSSASSSHRAHRIPLNSKA